MLSSIDCLKIREFVEDAVGRVEGRVQSFRNDRFEVVIDLACREIERVSDLVNQRLGRYAYPWESYVVGENLLVVGVNKAG